MGRRHQKAIGRRARPSSRPAPVETPPTSRRARARSSGPFGDVSPERLADWIEDYLAELAATEHRPRTLKNYRHALLRLRPELRAAGDAAGFLRALAGLAPATRAFYLAAARGFDAWCVESGRTRARALGGRARVKLDAPAPKPFELAELRQLGQAAAAADPWRGRPRYARLGARVRLLVVLLQETGVRIEDALALRWRDVVLAPGREGLHVRAPKGRAGFFLPLLPGPLVVALKRAARAALADAGDVAGDVAGDAYVLAVDARGARPWSYRAALRAFQKVAAAAGVARATPHRMRHSRATQLVEDGITTHGLQRAMAWAKLDTAARYVNYTAAHLRRELERLPTQRR